jgi:hypothetical protein
MATSSSSNTQQQTDSSEKIAQQFLSNADDYFRSEIKCRFQLCFIVAGIGEKAREGSTYFIEEVLEYLIVLHGSLSLLIVMNYRSL